jgi:PTH1 family peptidyl-tRNA hydrolase
MPEQYLIVGLGNPGARYANTPHNLGFLTIDRLGEAHGIRVNQPDSSALVGRGSIGGVPAMLAKPQTFMNLSGGAVRRLMEKYSFVVQDLLLVYDELALPWKNLRIRPSGSAGGHNGVGSVISSIQSSDFARLRLGIHPGHPVRDGAEFVLAPMKRAQMEELDEVLDTACRAIESIIAEGVEKSMAKYNRRAQGPTEEE